MYASSGVSGDGLRITVQPASSAGASLAAATNCGTFHGTTAATTPTGSRRTRSGPSTPSRRSSYVKSRATVIAASHTIIAPSACARTLQEYGEPFCELMTRAISSCRTAIASLIRRDDRDPLLQRHPRPGPLVERPPRRRDRPVHIGPRGVRHAPDDLLGVRRDDLDDVLAQADRSTPRR